MDWYDGGYQRKLDDLIEQALAKHDEREAGASRLTWSGGSCVSEEEWVGLETEVVSFRHVNAYYQNKEAFVEQSPSEWAPARKALDRERRREEAEAQKRDDEKRKKDAVWKKVLQNKENDPTANRAEVKRRSYSQRAAFSPVSPKSASSATPSKPPTSPLHLAPTGPPENPRTPRGRPRRPHAAGSPPDHPHPHQGSVPNPFPSRAPASPLHASQFTPSSLPQAAAPYHHRLAQSAVKHSIQAGISGFSTAFARPSPVSSFSDTVSSTSTPSKPRLYADQTSPMTQHAVRQDSRINDFAVYPTVSAPPSVLSRNPNPGDLPGWLKDR
ncbi:hypothetical protein DIPPA_17493 [Diplonema papillatum]|nr:hypothetical protein DIPPA_17493 [Diplonema papillatum]